jgi:hypothetical protein
MPNKDFCTKRLIFPGQKSNTCWFVTMLMCVMYSEKSRKRVLQAFRTATFNKKFKLFELLEHLLKHKYVKSKNPKKDKKSLIDLTPEYLMKKLNLYDSYKFMMKDITIPWFPHIYIKSFYELFGMSCMMYTVLDDKRVIYEIYNNPPIVNFKSNQFFDFMKPKVKSLKDIQLENNYLPDILCVLYINNLKILNEYDKFLGKYPYYQLNNDNDVANILSNNDTITYHNIQYELDSMIVGNIDGLTTNHVVAGITCKEHRYIYNGWMIKRKKYPCNLMKFEWNAHQNDEKDMFCINTDECKLHMGKHTSYPTCYLFGQGYRLLVYVKKSCQSVSNSCTPSETPEYVSFNMSKSKLERSSLSSSPQTPKTPSPVTQSSQMPKTPSPVTQSPQTPKTPSPLTRNISSKRNASTSPVSFQTSHGEKRTKI